MYLLTEEYEIPPFYLMPSAASDYFQKIFLSDT